MTVLTIIIFLGSVVNLMYSNLDVFCFNHDVYDALFILVWYSMINKHKYSHAKIHCFIYNQEYKIFSEKIYNFKQI